MKMRYVFALSILLSAQLAGQTADIAPRRVTTSRVTVTAAAGGGTLQILGADSSAVSYTVKLPDAAPTAADQCLQTSGSSPFSTLVWGACAGGGPGGGNPFSDTDALVMNQADNTKRIRISASTISTGETRVWTPPDADIGIPGTNFPNTWISDQTFSGNILASGGPSIGTVGDPFNFSNVQFTRTEEVDIAVPGTTFGTFWKIVVPTGSSGQVMRVLDNAAGLYSQYDSLFHRTTWESGHYPNATLSYDFGSTGARWRKLWVQDIDLSGTCAGCGGGGGSTHNFLSATHPDTITGNPVLGDMVYADATPAWTKVPGNTLPIKRFLTQTGTGSVSAAPEWEAMLRLDLPTLNVNTLAPLSGGGNLGAGDLTLACPTCVDTTTNGQSIISSKTFTANQTFSGNILASGGPTIGSTGSAFNFSYVNFSRTNELDIADPGTSYGTYWRLVVPVGQSSQVMRILDNAGATFAQFDTLFNYASWTASLRPNGSMTYDLGASTTQRWRKLWVGDIDVSGTCTGCGGGGGPHSLLSATHPDTVAAAPVLGDMLYGNATPAWMKVAGNTLASKRFLTQTGTGAVSAAPTWAAVVRADLPALNVNTSGPLSGGGNLGAGDLTLDCANCVTLNTTQTISGLKTFSNADVIFNGTIHALHYIGSGNFSTLGTITSSSAFQAATVTSTFGGYYAGAFNIVDGARNLYNIISIDTPIHRSGGVTVIDSGRNVIGTTLQINGYGNVVNSSGQFVGAGVDVRGSGVGGAGFNFWNGGSYESGLTNAGYTCTGTVNLTIKGGVITAASCS